MSVVSEKIVVKMIGFDVVFSALGWVFVHDDEVDLVCIEVGQKVRGFGRCVWRWLPEMKLCCKGDQEETQDNMFQ